MKRIAALLVACGGLGGGCVPDPGGFTEAAPTAGSDYLAFGAPERVTITGYGSDAMEPFITRDGAYLLYNDSNAGPDPNLRFARRVDDLTFADGGEIAGADSPSTDGVPTLDAAGELFFVSPRSYDATMSTIYAGTFADGAVTGVALVPGVSRDEATVVNFDVEVSADGNTLYFVDGVIQPGAPAPKHADLVIAERSADGLTFTRRPDSAVLMANINSEALEYAAAISADELELFFDRVDPSFPGAMPTIYRATRPSRDAPFGLPQRVSAATGFVEGPTLSPDGTALYYHVLAGSQYVIERVTRPR